MTRKFLLSGFGVCLLAFGGIAQADPIDLFDYGLNIDGTVSVPTLGDPVPAEADISGFDDITGLGEILITITGAGPHNILAFFDHELDEDANTFYNELGATSGAPAAGQSWEIDEPGFIDGDIFENFSASLLDNGIGTSVYGDTVFPDDVSLALGWNFTLAAGETAEITFMVSETAPGGFYLSHSDDDSATQIFLSSALRITGDETPVPEPGTLWLLGAGLLGLGLSRRRNLADS